MSLKTYKAYSMAEALAAVRQDLGPQAVILHTRTFKAGGFLGIGRRSVVEVTARAEEAPAPEKSRRRPTRTADVARSAYQRVADGADIAPGGPVSTAPKASREALSPERQPVIPDRERIKRLALAMAETHERQRGSRGVSATVTAPRPIDGTAPAESAGHSDESKVLRVDRTEPVARRYVLKATNGQGSHATAPGQSTPVGHEPPARGGATSQVQPRGQAQASQASMALSPMLVSEAVATRAGRSVVSPPVQRMQDELSAIRDMVGQVLQRQVTASSSRATAAMPRALFDMYLKLVAQDVSEELADQIIASVRAEIGEGSLDDEEAIRAAALRHLTALIPAAEMTAPLRIVDNRPHTIALVGPTGVGKTTTVAKLAAAFKLRQHRRVGLITADTYRIAAVDQLRTYADIIGLPLHVATTPADMSEAIQKLRDVDVILIDTAGRSQNDHMRLGELREMIVAARAHEVHLVLSSTASEKAMLKEAEAFAQVGIDKVVLTKLDEAVSFGVLINVMQRVGKQLSFVTTGQEVPDHLEPGRPQRLAELVLGGDVRA